MFSLKDHKILLTCGGECLATKKWIRICCDSNVSHSKLKVKPWGELGHEVSSLISEIKALMRSSCSIGLSCSSTLNLRYNTPPTHPPKYVSSHQTTKSPSTLPLDFPAARTWNYISVLYKSFRLLYLIVIVLKTKPSSNHHLGVITI